MNPIRRALLATPLLAAAPALAQGFAPQRPVRIVVPFAAGASMDSIARLMARGLEPRWHQPVVVENRTGAGGNVGAQAVAQAAPDGHTLLIAAAGMMTVSPHLYRDLPFDLVRDLAPVAMLGSIPNVMVVPASSPVRDVAGFLAAARAAARPFTYGSPGSGSYIHVTGALFARETGLPAEHVAYRGSAPALVDLVAGRIDVMFENLPGALPFIRDGRLRALAVTSPARSPFLPEVPSTAEAGLPGVQAVAWFAAYAPGRTDAATRARIAEDLAAVQRGEEAARGLGNLGLTVEVMGPGELGAMVDRERARFGEIVRGANITLD
ncbi:Bug family tripartite tricarboxylate transporter substrate binding protein [Falsiroseomonas sp. CW058]|uniref:Bug family tripartite tricarboxylate transporter substrate binding protein n=1 Tax=Falsiroseomonas sp. CW058 TaxID=3388664 RepID=UPI003D311445